MSARARVASAVVLGVLGWAIARAEPPGFGTEFQVNAATGGWQVRPAVAVDEDGDFVVAWMNTFGTNHVLLQRFRQDGLRRGAPFQVDPVAGRYPAIAFDGAHTFVVAWARTDAQLTEATIEARRYHENGDRLGATFEVADSLVDPSLQLPAVAANSSGEFVVAWKRFGYGSDIFARVFDAGGAKGPEFRVNAMTNGIRTYPVATMDQDGAFLIVWQSLFQDGDQSGIFARSFDDEGAPLGPEFQVNSYTPSAQWLPGAAMTADGDFVIAWTSFGQTDDYMRIFARRFDSSGQGLAVEFQVDTTTGLYGQWFPDVAMNDSGEFMVSWVSGRLNDTPARGRIFARRYRSDGAADGGEFLVNSYTPINPSFPAVAMDPRGRTVVVWQSEHDGDGYGIFGQRFGDSIAFDVDADGTFGALTDALVLLRLAFGFQGDALVSGAVNLGGCTRCTAEAIETFAIGLGFARDIDGDGEVAALTDGLTTLRWAFGQRGSALTDGTVSDECTRCTGAEIDAYLTSWAD